MSEASAEPHVLARDPAFVRYWIARVAAMIAHQMLSVAIGWQVYALTGRALDLGLVGLAQFVPAALLVLVSGHVADRVDRRRILQVAMAVEAAAAALLAAGSAQGWIGVGWIFALVALIGAARSFQAPAFAALLPLLVPRSVLARAVATNASATQAAVIVGPALGGFIYVAGPAVVYGAAAALFALPALLLGFVRLRRPADPAEPPTLSSLFAGIRYVAAHRMLLGAISLDLFAVLLGGATALLPIYARDILHTGPWGLGLLRSASAVGALAMAIRLAHRPIARRAGLRMFQAVAVFGAATIVFGLSTSFLLSALALALLGASDMVSVVVRSSLIQLHTPDAMRGRVSAVNALFIGTSNQLGEFESGATAALWGAVPSVIVGGLGTLAVVLLWMRWFPSLAHVDRLETPAPVRNAGA